MLTEPATAIMATGLLVGLSAALLGPFLVLRRNAMLTDAISHSIVFGIAMVWLVSGAVAGPLQILGAGLTGVATVALTEALVASGRVKDDAAIGLVFPALFSLGVLVLNLYARDVHLDAHTVLLGEIGFVWLDVVEIAGVEMPRAVLWMGVVTALNAGFVLAFWKELKLATFDPVLAQAMGFRPALVFYALLFLLSGTAVAAFDAVGVVLFVAFVIAPAATAYLLTDRLGWMVGIAMAVAAVSTLSGYRVAVAWDVSIGGMMAVMTGVCLAAAFVFAPKHGVLARRLRRFGERRGDATRALLVHLMSHEGSDRMGEENVRAALSEHLGWSRLRASEVLQRSLRKGYVLRDGETLHLTESGRQAAEAVVAPWRRGG